MPRKVPVLVTDAGSVLEPPAPPPRDAPVDEWIAHMRVVNEFNDRVSDIANRAFERAFLREIRKP